MERGLPSIGSLTDADQDLVDPRRRTEFGSPVESPDAAHPAFDWNAVHEATQGVFEGLAARILAQEPNALSKAGRNSTRALALLSYRVFYHLDGDDYDPVVVGISFAPSGDRIQIAGDISGDESGFVYYDDECSIETTRQPRAVVEAAKEIAERLAAQESTIIDAIRHRHPRAILPSS
jgi:hypothetical protein